MPNYPNVKNAHIVPATYLRNWAIDGKIAVWLVPEGKRIDDQPVENVGTRRRFYRRKRPDGSDIDDIEWSLSEMEANAAPLLRSFATDWPLCGDDKLKLAVLFAFQLLRGPRWKEAYKARTLGFLDEYDAVNPTDLPPAELEEYNAELAGDSHRLLQMMSTGITATGVFASMHWTVIEFERPLIATSDHPLVLWPGVESRSPVTTEITLLGVLECVEVRLPLSPTHGLLMTWSDHPDDDHAKAKGTSDHAANFNAFTVASAERQWFHRQEGCPAAPAGISGRYRSSSSLITRPSLPPSRRGAHSSRQPRTRRSAATSAIERSRS